MDPPYALPLDEPIAVEDAQRVAGELADTLEGLDVTIARSAADFQPGRVTAIMHLEGADPLAPDLSDLHRWYDRGLRSIGLVWSRPNAFAEGVPFVFPGSPDTGPGLTDAGRLLVRACNRHGHPRRLLAPERGGLLGRRGDLERAARRDALERARALRRRRATSPTPSSTRSAPRTASSASTSPSRSCAPTAAAIRRRRSPRSCGTSSTSPSRIGVDHVAFGSDFEGAAVPDELGGAARLPKLVEALRAAGFDHEAVAKITHGNWLRVLDRTWRPWRRYFDHAGDDPRETLLDAMRRFDAPGLAVDLGCGTGRDTAALLDAGWNVVAIDGEQEAIDRLRAGLRIGLGAATGTLVTDVARFEDATLADVRPPQRELLAPVLPARPLRRALGPDRRLDPPGGRFCGQLFGDRDEWAGTGITRPDPRRGRARCCARSRSSAWRRSTRTARRCSGRPSTGTSSTSSRASADRRRRVKR